VTYSKQAMLHSVLEQCGEVAERLFQAHESYLAREKEFAEIVGPGLKATAMMRGVSLSDLSKATGLSTGMWTNIFRGRNIPTRRQYIDAVRLLNGETSAEVLG